MEAERRKLEAAPPLPNMLPLVDVRLTLVAVIVLAAALCVSEPAVVKTKLPPADDGPFIDAVPADVSVMKTF